MEAYSFCDETMSAIYYQMSMEREGQGEDEEGEEGKVEDVQQHPWKLRLDVS